MELKEGIEKVLTAASDSKMQDLMLRDPEPVVKGIVEGGLGEDDVNKIVVKLNDVKSDNRKLMAFRGLLAVPSAIPGLAELTSKKGGYEVLMKYVAKDETDAGPSIHTLGILAELLSSTGGTEGLARLIGMGDFLPDLNSMLALFKGSDDQKTSRRASDDVSRMDPSKQKSGDPLLDAIGSLFNF